MAFIWILILFLFSAGSGARADFSFSDEDYRGQFSTEGLDAIIERYELYDGYYWTTQAEIPQTYHGQADKPGWTETAVTPYNSDRYLPDWYGCRWGIEQVSPWSPGRGGYGECFGFAQFIGYLLSGDINPQGHWKAFYSLESAGGLQVGDIVRVEYTRSGHQYRHSAVVYAVYGEEVRFLQVSGGGFNRISVDAGFSDGQYKDLTLFEDIAGLPYLKISRSPDRLSDISSD